MLLIRTARRGAPSHGTRGRTLSRQPALGRVHPRRHMTTIFQPNQPPLQYGVETVGTEGKRDFRMYITYPTQSRVSPWHDIPLFSGTARNGTLMFNFVTEIPRGTTAKMEVCKEEEFNPIRQDEKNGELRYLKYSPALYNYGMFPQTWEDPNELDPDVGKRGDNDPLDVIDIGFKRTELGSVSRVKLIGALALIDEDETDWKILVCNITDPKCSLINNKTELEVLKPGLLHSVREWYRDYKMPEGKPRNQYAFDGELLPAHLAGSTQTTSNNPPPPPPSSTTPPPPSTPGSTGAGGSGTPPSSRLSGIFLFNILEHVVPGTKITPRVSPSSLVEPEPQWVYEWSLGPSFSDKIAATKDISSIVKEFPADKWEVVSSDSSYLVKPEDANRVLRLRVWDKLDQPTPRIAEKLCVILPPTLGTAPSRKMIPVEGVSPSQAKSFTVMSYNILSKYYADSSSFPYCPRFAREWDYRRTLICDNVIGNYQPDILCSQETNEDDLKETLGPFMKSLGYEYYFTRRPGKKLDGCLISWKKDKFDLVHSFDISFDDIDTMTEVMMLKARDSSFIFNNVAAVTLLRSVEEPNRYVWVSNSHLYWSPGHPTAKLLQAYYMLRKLHKESTAFKKKTPNSIFTHVLCGDFNSMPDSAVYELITKKSVPRTNPAATRYSLMINFAHEFSAFCSAYDSVGNPHTNVTETFSGCLDYVFYEKDYMEAVEILESPVLSPEQKPYLTEYSALPNPYHPSDHIPIMARLRWKS